MKRSVCILDDDSHVASTISRMVTVSGFTAHAFTNPTPFLAEIAHAPPALIILDLVLLRASAVNIVRQLEKLQYKGLVLLVSGQAGDVLSEAACVGARHGLHMLPPLTKPFRMQQLSPVLKALQRPWHLATPVPPAHAEAPAPPKVDFPGR